MLISYFLSVAREIASEVKKCLTLVFCVVVLLITVIEDSQEGSCLLSFSHLANCKYSYPVPYTYFNVVCT